MNSLSLQSTNTFLNFKPMCPNGANSTLFDQSFSNCYISPAIEAGHGMVKIFCEVLGIDEVFGFYPGDSNTNGENSEDKSKSLNQFRDKNAYLCFHYEWFEDLKDKFRKTFPFVATPGSIKGSIQVSGSKKCGVSSLSVSSLPTSSSFFAKLFDSDIYEIFQEIYTGSMFDDLGKVVNDRQSYSRCLKGFDLCKIAKLASTPNQVLKALKWAEWVRLINNNASHASLIEEEIPLPKEYDYNPFSHNCIDFVLDVIDQAGHTNWHEQLQDNQPISLSEKVFAVAWNYFHYKKWKSF